MTSYIENFKSKMDWANVFVRTGNFPLDRSSIFSSYNDAVLYASGTGNDSRGLGKTSYVGQILTVYENDEVNVYKINPDRSLEPVGSGNGSVAISNVTIVDGKVQEATAENIGQIIYITEGTSNYPAGPYIVTGDGTIAKLGTTTASGDMDGDINTLKGDVSTLKSDVATAKTNIADLTSKTASLEAADQNLQSNIDTLSGEVIKDVKVNGESLVKTKGSVNVDLSAYAKTADLPVYTISKVETEEGFAGSYKLMKDGVASGVTINIPKDKVLQSALIKVVETENQPVAGYKVGDKYFEFTFQNQEAKMYLLATELVDVYTAGSHISISENNEISVDVNTLSTEVANNSALINKFDAKGAASDAKDAAIAAAKSYTDTTVAGYVAKEEGKGLSSNDFTDEDKSKLDGVDAGAQVNIIEAVSVNGTFAPIESKTAKITYVDSLDALTEDEYRAVTARAVAAKFQTVNNSLASKFTLEEVDSLPLSGSRYTVYMKKIVDGEQNIIGYEEYLWMNNAWHAIGSSMYATKALASANNDGLMSKEHYVKLDSIGTISAEELNGILNS